LTPWEREKQWELYQRWLRQGKTPCAGLWNLAGACARSLSAYPRDTAWGRRMKGKKNRGARTGWYGQTPEQRQWALANLLRENERRREEAKIRRLIAQSPDGKLRLRSRIPGPFTT